MQVQKRQRTSAFQCRKTGVERRPGTGVRVIQGESATARCATARRDFLVTGWRGGGQRSRRVMVRFGVGVVGSAGGLMPDQRVW